MDEAELVQLVRPTRFERVTSTGSDHPLLLPSTEFANRGIRSAKIGKPDETGKLSPFPRERQGFPQRIEIQILS